MDADIPGFQNLDVDGTVHAVKIHEDDDGEPYEGYALCDAFEWFYVETFKMTKGVRRTDEPVNCILCLEEMHDHEIP